MRSSLLGDRNCEAYGWVFRIGILDNVPSLSGGESTCILSPVHRISHDGQRQGHANLHGFAVGDCLTPYGEQERDARAPARYRTGGILHSLPRLYAGRLQLRLEIGDQGLHRRGNPRVQCHADALGQSGLVGGAHGRRHVTEHAKRHALDGHRRLGLGQATIR